MKQVAEAITQAGMARVAALAKKKQVAVTP
jgi:hypothetical protein